MGKLGKESLGKWGADGNFGNTSKAAYRKFREEGYTYNFSGKSEEKVEKPELKLKTPGVISNAINYAARKGMIGGPVLGTIVKGFTHHPYEGTEEEARKLGYKYYTEDGFTRKPVIYSENQSYDQLSPEEADKQMKEYSITSVQARDKSPVSTFLYNYSPSFGYNVPRLIENAIRGNKVRENGNRTMEKIETPVADKIWETIEKTGDKLGWEKLKKYAHVALHERTNDSSTSPNRHDLINFYAGYPIQNNTIRISPRSQTGNGGVPEQGYFTEFTNSSNIYKNKAYREAKPGQGGV
jgi:hypothetical protein